MDLQIAEYIAAHRSTDLTALMQLITLAGYNLIPVIVFITAVVYFFLKYKRFNEIILLSLSVGIGQLSALLLKNIIMRPRPPLELAAYLETGFAMPSAHALLATGFYGMLFYLLSKEIKNTVLKKVFWVAAVLFILLLCFSRIYLGVHWTSDVLVGFGLGIILNITLLKLYPVVKKH